MGVMADWSLLPEELSRLILSKLSSPLDNARSGAVCKLWHSIYKEKTFPWLLSIDRSSVKCAPGFFSLSDRKVYHVKLEHEFICGASHGYLVNWDACLLNPFSRTQIQLPRTLPFNICRHNSLGKVVMSSDPRTNPSSCIIMAYACRDLAYCRLGDEKWTRFPKMDEILIDLVFCKGQFYARTDYDLFICHIDPEPHLTELSVKIPQASYLVDLAGDLLMINHFVQGETPDETDDDTDVFAEDEHESHDEDIDNEIEDGLKGFGEYPFNVYEDASVGSRVYDGITCCFSVFKLDEKGTSWMNIKGIGDQALLLGLNCSVALPASSFSGCAANAIYYAHKYWLRQTGDRQLFNEVGIFHFKDRRIHSQYVFLTDDYYDDDYDYPYDQYPPPIWLVQGSL